MIEVFRKDGYIDRYSGRKLIFPPLFRIFQQQMPECFPAHPNWKRSESHPIYWEYWPEVDHLVPVARGGVDAMPNWVTASVRTNRMKAEWTLEELGWDLHPSGSFEKWDGLEGLYKKFLESQPERMKDAYLGRWYRALLQ